MNGRRLTDAQISRALRSHLPERAYPGLRERILEATDATTQQPALPSYLGPLGAADATSGPRTLLLAAALLVALALASAAAIGALRLLQRDPVRVPSPEPSRDVPFVISGPVSGPGLTAVAPGTYRMREPGESPTGWPSSVIVTIPAQWHAISAARGGGLVRTEDYGLASLKFSIVGNLVADPCADGGTMLEPPLGSSANELVAGLRSMPSLAFSEPVDVPLDGWAAKRVELTHPAACGDLASCELARPADLARTECRPGQPRSIPLWLTPPDASPGESWGIYSQAGWHSTFWILDVEGIRFVAIAAYELEAPPEVREELRQMVDSIDIEP